MSEIRKLFVAFREQCIWLQDCYNAYAALYDTGDDTKQLLHAAASLFFRDLNLILIEYVLLQVCKITDPPVTLGHPNLTIDHVNDELRKANLMTPEIEQYAAGMKSYCRQIKDARNKLISHLDRDTILNQLELGAHAQQDVETFFNNLHGYTDAVGVAVGEGPLDYRVNAGPGDVLDLLKVLRQGSNMTSPI
jgi:hypothetical protein